MKANFLLTALVVYTMTANCQIPNSGFEQLDPDGRVSDWSSIYIVIGTFDSTGVYHTDSMVYDNDFYFPTNDAHSGLRAIEMRNAFNYTRQEQIAGRISVSELNGYGGFSSPISNTLHPTHFSFYYKFLPAGSDTAVARMVLYDSNVQPIGESEIEITSTASTYSLAIKQVSYTVLSSPVAFATVGFSTSKSGIYAPLGTRFLVDDVNFLTATSLSHITTDANLLRCFPNPVIDLLEIHLPSVFSEPARLTINDLYGNVVMCAEIPSKGSEIKADVSELDKGIYFVTVLSNGKKLHSQFIK